MCCKRWQTTRQKVTFYKPEGGILENHKITAFAARILHMKYTEINKLD